MLIDKLKMGSAAAFRELLETFSQEVIQTCNGFVHNLAEAEDLAQEVFIEVYRSINQFRGDSTLKTWIYRISVNKSLDYLRKQKRKKRLGDLRDLFVAKNRPAPTPVEALEADERRKILHEQINLLSENQRIALILSQFDQLSNKDIAEIMAVSESAVESLLHRARVNLRKKLGKYFKNMCNWPQD